MSDIDKSNFTASFMLLNRLERLGFYRWIFHDGMGFRDDVKWWADKGGRPAPHEGVDFCCYENRAGQLLSLSEETLVPVMYDGEVIKIFDDFQGKSILIGHEQYILGTRLYSVYGHTRPAAHLTAGSQVAAGEAIGALSSDGKYNHTAPASHGLMGTDSTESGENNLADTRRSEPGNPVRPVDLYAKYVSFLLDKPGLLTQVCLLVRFSNL